MKIDAHQHFWVYDPIRDSWMDDSMTTIQRDFLPDELKGELDHCQIDGCVAVQADQSEAENEFLLDLASKNPFVKGVVGWVDLCASTVEERLAHFAANPLFKGVRHILQSEADDQFMLRDDFKRGIAQLSNHGLTYDILIFPKHLGTALELVRQFPEQPFVIDHLAKPLIKKQIFSPWEKDIRALAAMPNVYCKVSGLTTEANWHGWSTDHIYPYLDIVFDAFGMDRLIYGSDWPVCTLAGGYRAAHELLLTYTSVLPVDFQNAVFGGNACKFYKLEPGLLHNSD